MKQTDEGEKSTPQTRLKKGKKKSLKENHVHSSNSGDFGDGSTAKEKKNKNINKQNHQKRAFVTKIIDYISVTLLGVIIIGSMFFIAYTIVSLGNTTKPTVVTSKYEEVSWAPSSSFSPLGVKVVGAKELPDGCEYSTDPCWRDAIASGIVKFIDSNARILIPGYENREIVFAYFKNTSKVFGTSGLYNCLPLYKDDGKPVGADIFGGINSEIDWAYGTVRGVIIHDRASGHCYEEYFNIESNAWVAKMVRCPK